MYIRYTFEDKQLKLCPNDYELGYSFPNHADHTTVDDVINHYKNDYKCDVYATISSQEEYDALQAWLK